MFKLKCSKVVSSRDLVRKAYNTPPTHGERNENGGGGVCVIALEDERPNVDIFYFHFI